MPQRNIKILIKYLDTFLVDYNDKTFSYVEIKVFNKLNIENILSVIKKSLNLKYLEFCGKKRITPEINNPSDSNWLYVFEISCNKNYSNKCKSYKWISLNKLFLNFQLLELENLLYPILGTKICNYKYSINNNDSLKKFFFDIGYNTIKINHQNNSLNGILKKANKKYFFKVGTAQEIYSEIEGYVLLKNKYPIPKLIKIIYCNELIIIIMTYEDSIDINKGLLTELFNSTSNIDNTSIIFDEILQSYKTNMNLLLYRNNAPVDRFFSDRVDERIIKWYLSENGNNINLFDYALNINGTQYGSTSTILRECNEYFKSRPKLLCLLSQGDPGELNIGVKPIFLDLQTAGYNYLVAEISIFFWSVYIGGGYLYPKYHPKSYWYHENALQHMYENKFNQKYYINHKEKTIYASVNTYTSIKRKKFIDIYFNLFNDKRLQNHINIHLRYFIIYRIASVINLKKMEEYDLILNLAHIHLLFKTSENYLKYILKLIHA